MLHRSDPNTTGKVRRGLSMCALPLLLLLLCFARLHRVPTEPVAVSSWYTEMEEPLCQIFPHYIPNSRYYPDDDEERSDGGWRDQLPPTSRL